jgi:hypothetical protein
MTSAVIAHQQTGYVPKKLSHLIGFFVIAFSLFVAGSMITATSVGWSNDGQTARTSTSGAVILDQGTVGVGVTFGLLVFVTMIMTAAGFGATKHFRDFLSESFPRLISVLSKTQRIDQSDRRLSARLFGLETVVVLVLIVALPATLFSLERIWATVDTPSAVGQSFGSSIQQMSVADTKTQLGGDINYPWISDKVLEAAKPQPDWTLNTVAENLSGDPWQVGQLDAALTLSWTSKNGVVVFPVATESSVNTFFSLMKHPTFTLQKTPLALSLSAAEFYPTESLGKTTINGEVVPAGAYRAFPGVYHVVAEGYKLIAATDEWRATAGSDLNISVGSKMALPANTDEAFGKAADTKAAPCVTVDVSGMSSCFSADAIVSGAVVKQGTKPTTFFDAVNSEFTGTGTKCSPQGTTWLLSADRVARTVSCTTSVEFLTSYTKKIYAYVQQPIIKTLTVLPCSASENCNPEYVDVVTGYKSVLQESRGEVSAQTRSEGIAHYSFTLIGTLAVDGKLNAG